MTLHEEFSLIFEYSIICLGGLIVNEWLKRK
jgi:hypothetical protein